MQQLSDERRLIKEAAREFTMNRVLPLANKLDPEKGLIPRELIDEMAEFGYFAILIPEQYGGLGLGACEYCLVAEELARGWMSVASLIARGNGLIGALDGLTSEQKAVVLPKMAKGEFLGAFSLSEPNAGSEAAMAKLFASEMSEVVTSEGLQIHGGAGYTTHFAAERYWRDARLTKIFEGTSEIQKRIISDALLGKIAKA